MLEGINSLEELDSYENQLINEFNSQRVLSSLNKLSDESFRQLLLQKRFHSLAFTPLYDAAIDGLSNKNAIDTCRQIVREEYPPALPSHREDLASDLKTVGISSKEILKSYPTSKTLDCLNQLFSILRLTAPEDFHEIKVLTLLRFWGEVLVSEEYGKFIPRLEKIGLNRQNSAFYWPHFEHDKKKTPFYSKTAEKTHSDELTIILQGLLDNSAKVNYASSVEKKVFELKCQFYRQFEPLLG